MKIIKLLSLLFILVAFSGCKKLQENWIVGKWQVETLMRGDEAVYWEFFDDNTAILLDEPSTGTDTVYYSWAIKSKLGNYVEMEGEIDKQFDGKWFIEKMNSKLLLLTRREFLSGEKAGAFLRRELYK